MSLISAFTASTNFDMEPQTADSTSIDSPTCNVQLHQSTTTGHDCEEKLVSAPDTRASLLADSGHLNLDMDAASATMSDAAPSPGANLCAGRTSRNQGQHGSAITIYDNGWQHVAHSDDGYEYLLNRQAASHHDINKRVDFISKLPLELVLSDLIPMILDGQHKIDIGKEGGYLDVCPTWRERIAMAYGLTFRIGVPAGCGSASLASKEYDHLLDMAPYIKSLIVSNLDGLVPQLTGPDMFQSLRNLHITGFSKGPWNYLLVAVRALGTSLTDLTIDYTRFYIWGVSHQLLCDILDVCPNLTTISVSHGVFHPSSISKTYPRLVKLDLIDALILKDDISDILQLFPQLRLLRVTPMPQYPILSAIATSCPLLQQIILHNHARSCLPGVDDIQEGTGWRVLTLDCPRRKPKMDWRMLKRYLKAHCGTIERFEIGDGFEFFPKRMILQQQHTEQVTFKQLRHIRYPTDSSHDYIPLLIWLIQRAPRLESVGTVHHTSVFEELKDPKHQHFKGVGLKANRSPQLSERQFMQHHLDLGNLSTLEEIHLRIERHVLAGSWLLLIPKLTQLKHLQVFYEGRRVMRKVISPFISRIAYECPGLEQFTLTSGTFPIEYSDFSAMAHHGNLKTLVIDAPGMDGDESMLRSFVSLFQRLHVLHLKLFTFAPSHMDILQKGAFRLTRTQRSKNLVYYSQEKGNY